MATTNKQKVAMLGGFAQLTPDAELTTAEAAQYLSSSEATLQRMRADGIGPRFRNDESKTPPITYVKRDLDAWMASVKTGSKAL
jgi:hypothetical protein